MSDMYNRINEQCKSKKTNISAMCRDLHISRSSLSELNSGRTKTLSAAYTSMIANYFGVSVDHLLGKSDKKETPVLTKKDERDIKNKIDEILDMMVNQKGLLFEGDPLNAEAIASIRSAMELGMSAAKLKNKEKYNPYKNKKD